MFKWLKRKKKKTDITKFFTTWQMIEYDQPEKIAQVVLQEIIIYVIFGCFVAYMTISMTSTSMFYHHEFFRKLFVASTFESVEGSDITLMDIHVIPNIWNYLQHIQSAGFYWDSWSDSNNTNSTMDNKLLGVPRLRQLKVRNGTCKIASSFNGSISTCYGKFSSNAEDRNDFGPNDIYKYSNETSSNMYHGYISSYHGNGFVINLQQIHDTDTNFIETLKKDFWIDRSTRVVFLEFTVYNPNVNLFCIAKIVFECPPTGGVFPSYMFQSVQLIRYVTISDYILFVCQIIVLFFLIFYTTITIKEITCLNALFFYRYWNWITLLMLLFGYIGFAIDISALLIFEFIKKRIFLTDVYANLEYPANLTVIRDSIFGLFVFIVFIRLFKYLAISKTMGQLNSTFNKCRSDIQSFSLLFMLIFLAFSVTGYLFFGRMVLEFSGIGIAMFTLLRAVLGDFDYDQINKANSYLSPIYFLSFIFLVFFILLNMFLAIINDAYADVKSDIASTTSHDYLGQHVENAFRALIGRVPADVPFKEQTQYQDTINAIRNDLQRCGFKDSEIDLFFDRYNIDTTATVGSVDINSIMTQLEVKPDDNKEGKEDKIVTETEFQKQQEKLFDIERGISQLTSRVDCLLTKLDALEYVRKHKK